MKMTDKTDRELLELAARAAGLDVVMTQPFIGLQIRNGNLWRPLDDDGDALRLAVRMQLRVFRRISAATWKAARSRCWVCLEYLNWRCMAMTHTQPHVAPSSAPQPLSGSK